MTQNRHLNGDSEIAGRNIAVTGAGGFIGSAIVQTLTEQGASVRALLGAPGQAFHNPPKDVVAFEADILDSEALVELVSGCETVVHAAGPPSVAMSFEAPVEYARVHVAGTCAVAAACRKAGIRRLVYLSSAEVYGRADVDPVPENSPLRPRSPYAAAKAAAELFVSEFWLGGAGDAVILRPFSVYGPRMSDQSVMAAILRQAKLGQPVVLKNLAPVRDYCYVTDLAVAVTAACALPLSGLHFLNAGTGRGTSVGELAALVVEQMGVGLPIVAAQEGKRSAEAEIPRLIADPARARAVLRWEPGVSLREGVRRLIRFEGAR